MAIPINIEQLLTGRIAEWERLDFKKVPFDYRNRCIGDFLKELHLTEGRSTGFPKIRKALRQNGSPEPVFETDERNSYFLAHIDIHPAFKSVSQGVHQDGTQDRLEDWIVDQIRNNSHVSTEELAKISGKSIRTIKRHIAKIPYVKYIGSGYSGHWEISKEE